MVFTVKKKTVKENFPFYLIKLGQINKFLYDTSDLLNAT